jgi:translation initiation factor IF-1
MEAVAHAETVTVAHTHGALVIRVLLARGGRALARVSGRCRRWRMSTAHSNTPVLLARRYY